MRVARVTNKNLHDSGNLEKLTKSKSWGICMPAVVSISAVCGTGFLGLIDSSVASDRQRHNR
jgi:hypothetical protein